MHVDACKSFLQGKPDKRNRAATSNGRNIRSTCAYKYLASIVIGVELYKLSVEDVG